MVCGQCPPYWDDTTLGTTPTGINIPKRLWKVIVVMEPGQSIADINQNTDVIAVDLPNDGSAGGSDGWKQAAYLTNINTIENKIRLTTNPNFKLLSNVPDEIVNSYLLKGKIYDINKYPIVGSNLLAEQADSTALIFSSNLDTSIREFDRSTEESIIGHSKVTDDIFHLDINKFSSNDVSIAYDGSIQVSPSQIAPIQISKTQISPGQISSSEINVPQIGISQISTPQISSDRIIEFWSSIQPITQLSSAQNRSRQINITQIPSSNWQTDIGEVSFSSSIPSQRLFNGNVGSVKSLQVVPVSSQVENLLHSSDFTYSPLVFDGIDGQPIHNTTSNLLTNIYSTAQTLWHTTTPISLNFEITNLPTGQLAEGSITSYNPNGTPKTATITIDNDANGVGWFIDSRKN